MSKSDYVKVPVQKLPLLLEKLERPYSVLFPFFLFMNDEIRNFEKLSIFLEHNWFS